MAKEQYQDIYKRGGYVIPGIRECESRYVEIKKQLIGFKRTFSVVDIGANLGYFSFRIAEDFPNATCVLIEKAYGNELKKLALENGFNNIIVLKHKVDTKDLNLLAQCEHFDIVLALNIIHHIGDVDNCLSAIEQIGEKIIIETPAPNDKGACGQKNLQLIFDRIQSNYTHIGSFTRHTSSAKSLMGVKQNKKEKLMKKYWDCPKKGSKGISHIALEVDNSAKTYIKRRNKLEENRKWIEGINLRTYQYLNGVFPLRTILAQSILTNPEIKNHNDVSPWNMIVNGDRITLIDNNDPRQGTKKGQPNLKAQMIANEIINEQISPVETYVQDYL